MRSESGRDLNISRSALIAQAIASIRVSRQSKARNEFHLRTPPFHCSATSSRSNGRRLSRRIWQSASSSQEPSIPVGMNPIPPGSCTPRIRTPPTKQSAFTGGACSPRHKSPYRVPVRVHAAFVQERHQERSNVYRSLRREYAVFGAAKEISTSDALEHVLSTLMRFGGCKTPRMSSYVGSEREQIEPEERKGSVKKLRKSLPVSVRMIGSEFESKNRSVICG